MPGNQDTCHKQFFGGEIMHLTGKFEILTKLWLFGLLLGLSACGSGDSDSSPVNGNRDGKAGSMARFAWWATICIPFRERICSCLM